MILRKAYFLAKLYQNPWKTKQEIEKLQLNLLKQIVEHAYRTVPYYHNLFRSVNLLPLDIKKLEDIRKIPITRKDDLRILDIKQRLSSKYPLNNLTMYKTGGSTGKVIKVFNNHTFVDLRVASIFRTYLNNGYRFTDKIGVLQFNPIKKQFLYKFGILQRVEIPFQLSLDRQLDMLQALSPKVLEGYPSRLSSVSRAIIKNKIKGMAPKLIITNSETLTESVKNNIVSCFGIQPTNVYASWEFGNIAWECPRHEGLHINADLLKVEILKNEEVDAFDETGEIVVTDFFNKAMPLLRYATGDIGVKTSRPCTCGRKFPMIDKIIGRTSERLFLANGTETNATTAISEIMKHAVGVSEYQAIQYKKGKLDILAIADEQFNQQKEKDLENKLLKSLHLEEVQIIRVQKLKKTEVGKQIPFVSKVKT